MNRKLHRQHKPLLTWFIGCRDLLLCGANVIVALSRYRTVVGNRPSCQPQPLLLEGAETELPLGVVAGDWASLL